MKNTNELGNERISKLLINFSVPAITGMVVQALYNIVDGLFVGRMVGSMGLAGTAVARPLMNILLAFSMLFGVGTSALISIKMGERKQEEAQTILSNGFFMMLTVGIAVSIIGSFLIRPILNLTSSSDVYTLEHYAMPYARIIVAGAVFQMIGFALNHSIRAQGNPKAAMYTMIIGAVINTILDAWFVIGLNMGVQGAAIATIISQAISMIWVLYFFITKKSNIRLKLKLKPDFKIVYKIMAIGSSAFALQIAASLVMTFYNNGLATYGRFLLLGENIGKSVSELEKMGSDIALAAFGIINSISLLVLMPIFGINQGAQPIMGYNYGAKQYDRVRKTFNLAVGVATVWMVVCFFAALSFSGQVVELFSKRDENFEYLLKYGVMGIRIILLTLPIIGFQIVSTSYFQAVGKPKKAMVLSLSRQVLFLVPLLYIMPKIFFNFFGSNQGVFGLLWATPIADILSFIVTLMMVILEMKHLKKNAAKLPAK